MAPTHSTPATRRPARRRLAATGLLAAAAMTLTPAPAAAQPSLTVSPQGGVPGDQLTASGAGFEAGTIELFVDAVAPGNLVAGPAATDGAFDLPFAIPNVAPGPHAVIACRDRSDASCREQASASFRVVEPPPTTTTTTTSPVIVMPATTSTTTTTTTSPVIVQQTTTTSTTTTLPSVQIPSTTTPPPTVPPVVIGPTSSTNPDPPFDPSLDLAISTTSGPLPEAQPPGEIVPDVFVRGVEVTQGIQDLHSRMPLVADRRTTVRVHVGVEPGFAFVDGALLVERPGQADDVLYPDNGPISPPFERTDLDGALNFTLQPHHYGAGPVTFTAQAWSAGVTSIDDEPDSANNLMVRPVEFIQGDNPTVWLVALDDGAGPGPDVTDIDVILDLAIATYDDLLDFHPISGIDFQVYPDVAAPGPEATEPGLWDLDLDQDVDSTAHDRRHEPNQRMAQLVVAGVLGDDGDMVLGRIDPSIPAGGFEGWAGYGVAWSKPSAGTPSHEVGHNQGLDHVSCAGDTDGDGVLQEAEAGTIDIYHPTGLPPVCSLAPINPDGYFGYTNYRNPVTIYSNDPNHPQAAFPFMGYKSPGWPDPYHWCLLLDSYGVPCNPALIGVPPRQIVTVDCDPEPVGGGSFELELCLAAGPDVDDGDPGPGPLPEPAPAPDPDDLAAAGIEPATATVAMEKLTIAHEGFVFELPLEPESWMVVTGSIDKDEKITISGGRTESVGAASIWTASQVDDLPPPMTSRFEATIEDVAAGLPAIGALRLVDDDGQPLAAVPVAVGGGGHNGGAESGAGSSTPFATPVPWVDGAAALELLVDGAVADSFAIAAAAPEVTDVQVTPGDGAITVSWGHVVDDDDDVDEPALFTVQLSADGESWIPVAVGLTGTQYNITDLSFLPATDTLHVRVIAGYGGRAGAMQQSVPMTAIALAESGAAAPRVAIAGIPDGPVEEHEPIEARPIILGRVYNDIGRVKVQFHWDGEPVGEGQALSLRDLLTLGTHELAVTVIDPDGNEATATATIEVIERTTPTR